MQNLVKLELTEFEKSYLSLKLRNGFCVTQNSPSVWFLPFFFFSHSLMNWYKPDYSLKFYSRLPFLLFRASKQNLEKLKLTVSKELLDFRIARWILGHQEWAWMPLPFDAYLFSILVLIQELTRLPFFTVFSDFSFKKHEKSGETWTDRVGKELMDF